MTTPRRDDSNDIADTLLFYDPDAMAAFNAGLEAVQVNGSNEQDVVLANEVALNDKRGQVEVLVEEVQEQEEILLKPTSKDNDNEMLEEKKVPLNGE